MYNWLTARSLYRSICVYNICVWTCVRLYVHIKRKYLFTCRCKAKLHQGQHTSMDEAKGPKWASIKGPRNTHTTSHWPQQVAPPEDAKTDKKNVALCMEQGKRNTDLGEKKGKAWLQKDSLRAQGWDTALQKEPVAEAEPWLCLTVQQVCLWAQKHYEFISAQCSLTKSLGCFHVPASLPARLRMVLPLPPHLPPHTLLANTRWPKLLKQALVLAQVNKPIFSQFPWRIWDLTR